jgi:hypothetical protein
VSSGRVLYCSLFKLAFTSTLNSYPLRNLVASFLPCALTIMDLFTFHAKHQIIVCKPCACAIARPYLSSHTRNLHAHEPCRDAGLEFAKFPINKAASIVAECLKERHSRFDPRTQRIPRPLPTDPPLPDLKLYRGYQCSRCDFAVSRSKSSQRSLERHFNQQHRILPGKKGRPGRSITIQKEDKGPSVQSSLLPTLFCFMSSELFFPQSMYLLKYKS